MKTRHCLALFSLLLAGTALPALAALEENLVTGDMEVWSGSPPLPEGWAISGDPEWVDVTPSADAHSGSQSTLIEDDTEYNGALFFSVFSSLPPDYRGHAVRLTAWAKYTGGAGSGQIALHDGIGIATQTLGMPGVWTQFTLDYTLSAGAYRLNVMLNPTDPGQPTAWGSYLFDDVELIIETDGDGLFHEEELLQGFDSDDPDTDNDGLDDGDEPTDIAGVDADVDDDGLADGEEVHNLFTDPLDTDTDGDGLSDGLELGVTGYIPSGFSDGPQHVPYAGTSAAFEPDTDPGTTTDPLLADSDGDGYADGAEDANQNGRVDDGETDPSLPDQWWYHDGDADTYGDPLDAVLAHTQPGPLWLANAGDCNDEDASIHPGATEVCEDGIDQDCDGYDLPCAPAQYWYNDADSDGWGNDSEWVYQETAPPGFVAQGGDCDDQNPQVNPGAQEACDDTLDNDCDGLIDFEDAEDCEPVPWYRDMDDDGWGDPSTEVLAYAQPGPDYVLMCCDCDDSTPDVHPGAVEVCEDGIDQDCDGNDPDCSTTNWYLDWDGDGWGDPTVVVQQEAQPDGYVPDCCDCDDDDPDIHPGAPEFCDNIDNDCDGHYDEDPVDGELWYRDEDEDYFGSDEWPPIQTCQPQPPYIAPMAGDCDDQNPTTFPGAVEYCDDNDNDCDGEVDEEPIDGQWWYFDADGDTWGADAPPPILACMPPMSHWTAVRGGDCDDSDPQTYPDADEICGNGVDNDCDGLVDEDCAGLLEFASDGSVIGCGVTGGVRLHFNPRPETPPVRSYEVTFGTDAALSFEAASIAFTSAMQALADVDPLVELYSDVQDNGDGTATVMQALLGPTSGLTAAAELFSFQVLGHAEGLGTVQILDYHLRGLNNAPITGEVADGEVGVDCTGTGPVSNLSAAPGHGRIDLSWTNPPEPVTGRVFRALWHDGAGASAYPEYDDLPADLQPPVPASYASALGSADWTEVATVDVGATAHTDLVALARGIYLYAIYTRDMAGNYGAPVAVAARATNYWLGDVQPEDGLVNMSDVTLLGAAYHTEEGDADYEAILDIGPTSDWSGRGLPLTDSRVDFEDLMIMALNYNSVGPLPIAAGTQWPLLVWERVDGHTWALRLSEPSVGLKGLRLSGALLGGPPVVTAGALLAEQPGPVFWHAGTEALAFDLAVLGPDRVLSGTGEICRVRFPAGSGCATLTAVVRNSQNAEQLFRFEEAAPLIPAQFSAGAYPNPFNPSTTIWCDLPEAASVDLRVYDLGGRLVRELARGRTCELGRQEFTWDGRGEDGVPASSGIYLYRIDAGGYREAGRLVLLK